MAWYEIYFFDVWKSGSLLPLELSKMSIQKYLFWIPLTKVKNNEKLFNYFKNVGE